jgi:hypothetical protein
VEESGIAQGIWPQGKVHCLRPASTCVEQLLARALQVVADGALGDPILKMGIHTAEGELLLCFVAGLFEGVVLEAAIVAVVVEYPHTVLSGECLEGAFGSKSFRGRIVDLKVDKAQAAEVVDKYGGAPVAPLGKFAFHLRKETDFS